jgi:hypothetical protein
MAGDAWRLGTQAGGSIERAHLAIQLSSSIQSIGLLPTRKNPINTRHLQGFKVGSNQIA